MANDSELRVHHNWIGPLQPVGLLVSAPALVAAQAFPDQNTLEKRAALLALVKPPELPLVARAPKKQAAPSHVPVRFPALAEAVLGWKPGKLVDSPEALSVPLPAFHETLRPTWAVRALPQDEGDWMMLVQALPDGTGLDEAPGESTKKWHASPQVRFERLLKETEVPIGLLTNGVSLRLVYAPRGESSGHVTWPLFPLTQASHKDGLAALCMLLGAPRLFQLGREQRLPHILKESRKYQNVVSTKLAGQVLEALNELLRGFQAANDKAKGKLLDETVRENPEHIYGGLLAVLLRLVFVLYAEERGLLSSSALYVRSYSLSGLFEKLRVDHGRFPDTMDDRYGAWSRLLVLFRMIYDGARYGDMKLPPRYGHLFDPNAWGFLEGRAHGVGRTAGEFVEVPRVADGVVYRVLEKLLLLDGERLSYRALDVEQIGSVYENMMGFRVERAGETSIGLGKDHVVVGLDTLLGKKGSERDEYLKEAAGVELSGKAAEGLKQAHSIDDLVASLSRRISPLTPRTIPAGGIYLQPTDERRRSGSHYTPRELTEPIVRTTLRPVLEALGESPAPENLLALKVCDPAMGSGAFLVEACRQLGIALVTAWQQHHEIPEIPPDEDQELHARRLIAQKCIYGVDKNPFAVELAKLSLWLVTLAKEHPLTFLDHALREGDSLVGLSTEQIYNLAFDTEKGSKMLPQARNLLFNKAGAAEKLRGQLHDMGDSDDTPKKRRLLNDADSALADVRLIGDAMVASFFAHGSDKERKKALENLVAKMPAWAQNREFDAELREMVAELRSGDEAMTPFHWEIEFPEVFSLERSGFDSMIGNPPFLGGTRISTELGMRYFDWLTTNYPPAGHLCDLVAYFFRRNYDLVRPGAALGLLATKTIGQGDTREGGLATILRSGGSILTARRRLPWPGRAAVIVSAVHVCKGPVRSPVLDGQPVERISAFLLKGTRDENPAGMVGIPHWSLGVKIYGQGFLFDDNDPKASTTLEMRQILERNPSLAGRVRAYLGGEELNSHPTFTAERWTIYLSDLDKESDLVVAGPLSDIVRARVKPEREKLGDNPNNLPLRRRWWAYQAHRPEFFRAVAAHRRYLAIARISSSFGFGFVDGDVMISEKVVGFIIDSFAGFAVVQSRVHEGWARTFSSTLKDDLQYTPSDCFETFPFPPAWEQNPTLEAAGKTYYDYRAALMIRNNEGLTATYNRFHNPDETDPDILRLRDLHAAMDRAVLDAYGWKDIQPTCEFLLDYEEPEDDEDDGRRRRKKKPWRYRWPDDIRDEILARLLALNAERAKEEAAAQAATAAVKPKGKGAKRAGKGQSKLFGGEDR